MAQPRIKELIKKLDSFEIVRDQLAAILVLESAGQQALAHQAGENPDLWALRVFTERANAWDLFGSSHSSEDEPAAPADTTPIVNVTWSSTKFDANRSDLESQGGTALYYVDCFGYGKATLTELGHDAGDEVAAKAAQRAARVVRNILKSAHYVSLRLPTVVGRVAVETMSGGPPEDSNQQVDHVYGIRFQVEVDLLETSPQVQGPPLEVISIEMKHEKTSQLLLRTTFQTPFNPPPTP